MDKISVALYIILALSVILFLLIRMDYQRGRDKVLLVSKYAAFSLLCLSEIYYFLYEEDGMWFCDYKEIGWLKSIFGFIILCVVLLNQFGALKNLLFHLHRSNIPADFRIGFYSYIVVFIGLFVSSSIFDLYLGEYGVYALFVGQLIQVAQIFYNNRPYWKYSIASTLIYLLGTITLVIALIYFMKPLLFASIVIIILWLLSKFLPSDTIKIKIEQ